MTSPAENEETDLLLALLDDALRAMSQYTRATP